MLKILQTRLKQYVNYKLSDVHFFKAEEPEIKLPTSIGSSKSKRVSQNIYFCFIEYAKAFDCVDLKIESRQYIETYVIYNM